MTVREPLVRYGSPPRAEVKLCRTDGCQNLANATHRGGPYAGLCEETCLPAQREYLRATNGGLSTTEPEDRPVHADRACRTDDCENRANAKWTRGALAGLCWEACVPKMRTRLSHAGKQRVVESAHRTIETPPEPEPAALAPEPVPATGERDATLSELAADVELARRLRDDAIEVYEDAAAAFLEHPLLLELLGDRAASG